MVSLPFILSMSRNRYELSRCICVLPLRLDTRSLFPYRFCSTLDARAYDVAGSDTGSVGLDIWHARTSRGHDAPAPVSQSSPAPTTLLCCKILKCMQQTIGRGVLKCRPRLCMRLGVVASCARDRDRDPIVSRLLIGAACLAAPCSSRLPAARRCCSLSLPAAAACRCHLCSFRVPPPSARRRGRCHCHRPQKPCVVAVAP